MTETVTKKSLLSRVSFKLTEKNLLVTRKWLMIIAALNILNAGLDFYVSGLTMQVLFSAFVAMMLLVFSNKCETLVLKLRLEKVIEHQLVLE